MFSVFKSLFLAVLVGAAAIQGAPTKRQIGNLQCNINRVQIVSALAQMGGTLKTLAKETANDPATSAAVASAQTGLDTANSGVATIAKALLTGQAAPADARTQVEQGLNAVLSATQNVTSTDAQVTSDFSKLTTQLTAAGKAGDGVLANCK
ncbi:hypothetical protein BC629DRAFT_370663 [Irpex lacteus]|nr:hypothetical protein BC629DRAFT_370663 [Irpex lacteus]